MTVDHRTFCAVRSAIFLVALQYWKVSDKFSELGDETKALYNEYAAAAIGAFTELQVFDRDKRMDMLEQENTTLRARVEVLKDQIESASHEAAAMAALHERAEAELEELREQVRDMGAMIEAAIAEKGGAA